MLHTRNPYAEEFEERLAFLGFPEGLARQDSGVPLRLLRERLRQQRGDWGSERCAFLRFPDEREPLLKLLCLDSLNRRGTKACASRCVWISGV